MKRIKKRIFHSLCTLAIALALILEFYPEGLENIRMVYPGEALSDYFSYFSLTLFTKENPFPLITGILTILLLIFSLLKFLKKIKRRYWSIVMFITRGGAFLSSCASFFEMPTTVSFSVICTLFLSGIFSVFDNTFSKG